MTRGWTSGQRAAAALLCAAAAAAASLSCGELRPDLLEVYPDAAGMARRPVIIVPGAFGSRLRNVRTGEVVWGRFANLLSSRFKLILNPLRAEADLLDLPIESADLSLNRDDLVAFSVFEQVAGREFYRRIVRTLNEVAGYRTGDITAPKPEEDCFAFYYDWRRDVVENARLLGEAIERVRATRPSGERRVDIIAHSLGGLVTRYYLKYGGRDVLEEAVPTPTYVGARKVSTVVMIGVPNEGSLDSFASLHDGLRLVRRLPAEAVFTMPAAYQTLPHRGTGSFIDASGRRLGVDLYDPELWERYGWSAFHPKRLDDLRSESLRQFGRREGQARYQARLETMRVFLSAALKRAQALHAALERHGPGRPAVRFFAFGGDCIPTPARAMLLEEDGQVETITRLEKVPDKLQSAQVRRLMSEPGDGSVTRASLLARHDGKAPGLDLDYSLFLCDRHRNLTENITFQDNLLQFLLYGRGEQAVEESGRGAAGSLP
ncbi:MAG TPA: hypothetical protein VJV23_10745 [Candidatus Polarisedimenticolia bacterium]|nr:hypothetical protein [Candidatus Polarisedimenticolia bacterium]